MNLNQEERRARIKLNRPFAKAVEGLRRDAFSRDDYDPAQLFALGADDSGVRPGDAEGGGGPLRARRPGGRCAGAGRRRLSAGHAQEFPRAASRSMALSRERSAGGNVLSGGSLRRKPVERAHAQVG